MSSSSSSVESPPASSSPTAPSSPLTPHTPLPRVCVVGAGACGLIAARVFARHRLSPTVYEATGHLGGQWRYDPDVSPHSTSAIYAGLLTNLPHSVMQLSDVPFPPSTPTYPHHSAVFRYLADLAHTSHLTPLIHFHSTVTRIDRAPAGGYLVTTCTPTPTPTSPSTTSHFDAVCVCNGHFLRPIYPTYPGLPPPTPPSHLLTELSSRSLTCARIPPLVLHSVHYRTPHPFTHLRVLLIGSSHSATDIAGELCACASTVLLSAHTPPHLDPLHSAVLSRLHDAGKRTVADYPHTYRRVGAVRRLLDDGTVEVEAADSSGEVERVEVDVVLCATGYEYEFSFLAPSFGVNAGQHVSPLYADFLHPDEGGRLGFPALQWSIAPFPMCEVQCEWMARLIVGEVALPSAAEQRLWVKEEEEAKRRRGVKGRYLARCDSMVEYVRWVVEQMKAGDVHYPYRYVIDEDRRLRKQLK